MLPTSSPLVRWGISLLALAVLTLIGIAVRRVTSARVAAWYALGALAWLAATGVLAQTGFFAQFEGMPPRFSWLLLPTLLLPCWLAFSRVGTALAHETPLALLVLFQAFRLPLELVMHRAAQEGTMPLQMSYSGCNFDIVTGATALVVGTLAAWDRAPGWLLAAWNVLGSALLANILVVAVASMPVLAAFGREPERLNTWVAYFPFVWLPAGPVAAALLGHLLLWRRLLEGVMRGRASQGDRSWSFVWHRRRDGAAARGLGR